MVIKNKYYLCVVKIIHLILKTMLQLNTGDYFRVTTTTDSVWLAIKDKSSDVTGCQLCILIYNGLEDETSNEVYIGGLVADDSEIQELELANVTERAIIDNTLYSKGLVYDKEAQEIKPIKQQ